MDRKALTHKIRLTNVTPIARKKKKKQQKKKKTNKKQKKKKNIHTRHNDELESTCQ